jgi:hypothetical protein
VLVKFHYIVDISITYHCGLVVRCVNGCSHTDKSSNALFVHGQISGHVAETTRRVTPQRNCGSPGYGPSIMAYQQLQQFVGQPMLLEINTMPRVRHCRCLYKYLRKLQIIMNGGGEGYSYSTKAYFELALICFPYL